MNSLVAIANSRSQPSSWLDEVRSLVGQYGQTSGLFSCSGGIGISSNCVTLFAPWRLLVPTQSLPVSPPPITITCLPSARIWSLTLSPALTLFCCGRNSIAKWMPSRSRPGTGRSRELLGAAGQHDRVELAPSAASALIGFAGPVGDLLVALGSSPTSTPVRKTTPSACICATRRSMCDFSILKSGMP